MKDCWVTSNRLRNGSAGWPLRPGKVAVMTAHQWPLPRALCILCQSAFHDLLRCGHYNTLRTEREWFYPFSRDFPVCVLTRFLFLPRRKGSPQCSSSPHWRPHLYGLVFLIRYTDPRSYCGILGSFLHYRALQEK